MSISIFCVNHFNNSCHNRRDVVRSTSTDRSGRQSTIAAGMYLASLPADEPVIPGQRALIGGFVRSGVLVELNQMNDRMRPCDTMPVTRARPTARHPALSERRCLEGSASCVARGTRLGTYVEVFLSAHNLLAPLLVSNLQQRTTIVPPRSASVPRSSDR